MNENILGEQLAASEANAGSAEELSAEKTESSPLGKFKDPESLLSAYNNLQAEFTRRCQKLSELEKKNSPVYLAPDWNERVAAFLEKNRAAKNFSEEIANAVLSDPSLANEDNALDIAFARVVSEKYKDPEKALNDEDFLEKYVFSNDKIRSRILRDSAKQLKFSPRVMSGSSVRPLGPQSSGGAMSLAEAKRMVNEMLNSEIK